MHQVESSSESLKSQVAGLGKMQSRDSCENKIRLGENFRLEPWERNQPL